MKTSRILPLYLSLLLVLTLGLQNCKKTEPDPVKPGTTTPPGTTTTVTGTTAPTLDNATTATTSSSITAETAKVSSSIATSGGAAITQYGHVWSDTKTDPTTADSKTELGKTDGPFPLKFTSDLKPLKAGTTYNVRPYATNDKGTTYGTAVQVKTMAATSANSGNWKSTNALLDFTTTTSTVNPSVKAIFDTEGNTIMFGSFNRAVTIGTTTLTASPVPRNSSSAGDENGFITKYSPTGAVLWVLQFVSAQGFGLNAELDGMNNIYLLGSGNAVSTLGGVKVGAGSNVIKITPNGKVEWVRVLPLQKANAGEVHVDKAGNFYVTVKFFETAKIGTVTYTHSFATDFNDYSVAKFDPNGTFLWSQRIGGADEQLIGIDVDENGNTYGWIQSLKSPPTIAGNAQSTPGFYSFKLNTSGAFQWGKAITPLATERGIVCNGTDGFVLGINSQNLTLATATSTPSTSYMVAGFNSDGGVKWAFTSGIFSSSFDIDKNNNLYLAGGQSRRSEKLGDITLPTYPGTTTSILVVAKYNILQNKWLWAATSGSDTDAKSAYGLAIKSLANGNLAVHFATGSEGGKVTLGPQSITLGAKGGVGLGIFEPKP